MSDDMIYLLGGLAVYLFGLGVVIWAILPETKISISKGVFAQLFGWYCTIVGIALILLAGDF